LSAFLLQDLTVSTSTTDFLTANRTGAKMKKTIYVIIYVQDKNVKVEKDTSPSLPRENFFFKSSFRSDLFLKALFLFERSAFAT
jgi:hypothetical protein